MGSKNTSALMSASAAPAGYGGANAPVLGPQDDAATTIRVEKAVNSQTAGGGKASPDAQAILKIAAAMVVGGTILLWVFGGIVFKNANI